MNCWLSWKCWRLVGKGMDKDMERVYDLKSTAAPLICLKVCLRLAAKNPPNQVRYIESQGPKHVACSKNQQREEDLGTGNEPFGVRVAQMYHETLGFSTLFTLLFTLAHKPTGNRLDFTSIHSLLGAPACKFGFPMDFPSCLSSFLLTVIESSVGAFFRFQWFQNIGTSNMEDFTSRLGCQRGTVPLIVWVLEAVSYANSAMPWTLIPHEDFHWATVRLFFDQILHFIHFQAM